MFNNLSIRKKLALLLVGPILALLAIAGLGIVSGLSDLSDATDADRRVDLAQLNGRLFDAVRDEAVQNQNSVAIGNLNLDDVRSATDAAGAAWLAKASAFASLDVNDLIDDIQNIGAHRDLVSAQYATDGAGAEIVYEADMALLQNIVAFDSRLSGRSEAEVAAELLKANDLNAAALSAADAQLLGLWGAHAGIVPSDTLSVSISQADDRLDAYAGRAEAGEQIRAVSEDYAALSSTFDGAIAGDLTTVDVGAWEAATADLGTALGEARRSVLTVAASNASDGSSSAQGSTRNLGAIALIGLLLGLAALILVGNGLRTRLRTLSSEAAALAKHDLPELAATLSGAEPSTAESRPVVELEGSDELVEVSESLNDIRRATDSVSDQQAALLQSGISDMFVNLARRNQTLVDRQLEVIDQLESNERDSDRLAQMYRVDHLATRMRRNAESLLVLAGHNSPRRRGPAVDLREVVRVAIGEVEDYRRIVPVSLDELLVAGHVAQDLAHLLSELMENATQSSAPGTVADVIGLQDPAGGYVLQIIDRGTGLSAERLSELNHLLANPPSNNLSMSRSLGLTVVGRLAKRLSIGVALTAGAESGTVAAVTIPADVVTEWRSGEPASTFVSAPLAEAPASMPEPVAEAPAPFVAPDEISFGEPAPVPEPAAPFIAPTPAPVAETTILEPPAPVFQEPVPAPPTPEPSPFTTVGTLPSTPSEVFAAADVPPLPEPASTIISSEPDAVAFAAPPAAPAFEAPTIEAAALEAPTIEAPAFEAPAFEAPAFEAPAFEAPEAPAFEASTFEALAIDVPAMAPPATPAPVPPVVEAPAALVTPLVPQAPVAETQAHSTPPIPEPGAVFDLAPDTAMPPVPEPTPAPAAAPTPEPATTPTGLVRRRRGTAAEAPRIDDTRTAPSKRSPDQVKNMLSRYKTGLERGRTDGGQEPGQ
jgi:hypothetical protein